MDGSGRLCESDAAALVPWWSFTKTLIAAAALRLSEDGRLELDRPVGRGPFTLSQLLRHEAGLSDYGGLPDYGAAVRRGDAPWLEAELLARVAEARPHGPPGSGWRYSNIGYMLARREVERAAGAPLRELLPAVLFRPLGLASARVAVSPEDMRGTAFAGGQRYHPGWVYHGLVIGTAGDAARALDAILGPDLLGEPSRRAMLEVRDVGDPPPGRPWSRAGYGLGVMAGEMRGGTGAPAWRAAGHSAGGPGSAGAVYRFERRGIRVVAAAFTPGPGEGGPEALALSLAEAASGRG